MHRATCRRFDTIPADRQTDGIAVANTRLQCARCKMVIQFQQGIVTVTANRVFTPPLLNMVYFKHFFSRIMQHYNFKYYLQQHNTTTAASATSNSQ